MIGITVGTRPEIIRMASVVYELKRRKIPFSLIHTGQHYDYNMSKIFMEELKMPKPDYHLNYHYKESTMQIYSIMKFLESIFAKEKYKFVLVSGDTNSGLATALTSIKNFIPLGHAEAGPRCYYYKTPEETNRKLTDHVSTLLFAPSPYSKKLLLREGINEDKVFVTGNTVIDTCLMFANNNKAKIFKSVKPEKPYVLITLHRAETVDDRRRLENFVKFLELLSKNYDYNIVFTIHPRTTKRLKQFGLYERLKKIRKMTILDPLGYFDFLVFLKNAHLLITDSGGALKEGSALKVPVIVVHENWGDQEGYGEFWFLSGSDFKNILKLIDYIEKNNVRNKIKKLQCPFGDGKAAKRIVDITSRFLEGKIKIKETSFEDMLKLYRTL